MIFNDYSPPASPSLEPQRDALQKGLGRALQWALNGQLQEEPLLEACLRDQRFDVLVDDPRRDWLWRIIQAVGAKDRFRVPILHALYDLSDQSSANQLCGLARCYAETGDETFRSRLYDLVEQKPFPQSPWLGEEEIIALDGEQAFLFAAGVRGRSLANRGWDWDDRNLIDLAVQRLSEAQVFNLLTASSDPAVRRFRESWHDEKERMANTPQAEAHESRMKATPVDEIIRAANSESNCAWFRGWGRYADEAALQGVLRHLQAAQEPKVITNLLKVFAARALPEFDSRLIELGQHLDEEVRRRALCALEQNTHPLIREFALVELLAGVQDGAAVGLFINNYRLGDEDRILEAMEVSADVCDLHWLLMDVTKVLEKNPEADCSRLGVIAYALTPCENCRYSATRLLYQRQAAPQWLQQECRYDSAKECRELIDKTNESTPAT
jgi:hypothetical protein